MLLLHQEEGPDALANLPTRARWNRFKERDAVETTATMKRVSTARASAPPHHMMEGFSMTTQRNRQRRKVKVTIDPLPPDDPIFDGQYMISSLKATLVSPAAAPPDGNGSPSRGEE